jgi:hypothetical protein
VTDWLRSISIIDCINDEAIWGDNKFFRDPKTFAAWWTFLKVLFGESINLTETFTFRKATGRDQPRDEGYTEAWVCCGRKAGKSRILSLIACFLAVYRKWDDYLSPGEQGTIKVISVDRRQSRVIHRYVRAFLLHCEALAHLVERDTDDEITLSNGITIEIQSASYRSVRGYTCVAVLADETAFWYTNEDAASSDVEILNAVRPTMSSIPNAMLLCASSPYSRRGVMWDAFRRYHGVNDSKVLFCKSFTRDMNPTIDADEIRRAYERDPSWAASEYGGEFRTDLETLVSREVVEACVAFGIRERPPEPGKRYVAFTDPSGGSGDSFSIAIAHAEGVRGVLDAVRERRPPFSPESVIKEFSELCHAYGVHKVTGDRYAGQFPVERFSEHGVIYQPADKTKSELYVELLPLLNSKRVDLLDLPTLTNQLCSLERRTGRGTGRDSIDHPPRAHDDVSNAVAGVMNLSIGGDERSVIVRRYLLGSRAA